MTKIGSLFYNINLVYFRHPRFMRALVVVLALALLRNAAAEEIRLYTWQPHSNLPPLVIGVRKSETPQQASERYLRELSANLGLAELLQRSPLPELPMRNYAELGNREQTSRVLLIANRPEDYARDGNWRIASFKDPFNSKMSVFMVPFNADLGLSEDESTELIQKLDEAFPPLVPMGGDDLAVPGFNLDLSKSKHYNATRDLFEYRLLKVKIERILRQTMDRDTDPSGRKDRIAAVCRGYQFVGLILGLTILEHVDGHGHHNESPEESVGEGGTPDVNRVPLHSLTLNKTSSGVFSRIVAPQNGLEIKVATYHHQCVVQPPQSGRLLSGKTVQGLDVEIAAVAPDNIIEAFEAGQGRILGIQGHFELMVQRCKGHLAEYGRSVMDRLADFLVPPKNGCELDLLETHK
jgi:gamma-glutamyl-gamma-aminobutyrate hydrolase PuuD